MIFVSIAHCWAFDYKEYEKLIVKQGCARLHVSFCDHFAIQDANEDFQNVMPVSLPTDFVTSASSFSFTAVQSNTPSNHSPSGNETENSNYKENQLEIDDDQGISITQSLLHDNNKKEITSWSI